MGAVIQNGNFVGGLDAAVAAKIGDATLTTTASDLSGAVNELDAELGNEALPDPSKTVKGNINSLKQSLSVLIGQLQQQVTNLNDPLLNGCVYITFNTYPASASNKPTGNTGIIMTYGNGRFRQQVAFELAGEIYTRYSDNGSITAWTKRG